MEGIAPAASGYAPYRAVEPWTIFAVRPFFFGAGLTFRRICRRIFGDQSDYGSNRLARQEHQPFCQGDAYPVAAAEWQDAGLGIEVPVAISRRETGGEGKAICSGPEGEGALQVVSCLLNGGCGRSIEEKRQRVIAGSKAAADFIFDSLADGYGQHDDPCRLLQMTPDRLAGQLITP